MKTKDSGVVQQAQLSDGMRLIFDRESSTSSHSSSSSGESSYSGRRSSCSYRSRGSHRQRPRHRSPSSSSSDSGSSSSSDRRSHGRSRSRPRCHRASGHSRRHYHSPPRHYRAHSRSYSPSPDRSSRHGKRHRYRSRSRSSSHSSSRDCCTRRSCRSRSRSSSYTYTRDRYMGRYRCRFSPSPRRHRDYRGRPRSPERSIRLSLEERQKLLNIAKENAAKMLGVQNLELPASVRVLEEVWEKNEASCSEERVRANSVPQKSYVQDMDVGTDDDKNVPRTSPTRKPITFSINNTVAKPSGSPTFHVAESKVTSRADNVDNRKPYGQWVPVKKTSKKH